jgi:hypothetical protein
MSNKPNELEELVSIKKSLRPDILKVSVWLLVAGVTTYAGDEWFYHHRDSSSALRIIIALIPLPTILLWLRSMSRWIRGMDELQRRITLEISLFATTRTLLVILVWLRLDQIGVLKTIFQTLGKEIALHFENGALTQYCTLTGSLFFFFFWLGYLIINRRYK